LTSYKRISEKEKKEKIKRTGERAKFQGPRKTDGEGITEGKVKRVPDYCWGEKKKRG